MSAAVHVRYSGNGMLFEDKTSWLEESWSGVSVVDRLQVTPFDNVHAFPKRDINNSKTFMRASTKVKNIPSLLNRAF